MSNFKEAFAAVLATGMLVSGCAGPQPVQADHDVSLDPGEICARDQELFERDVRSYEEESPGKLEEIEGLLLEIRGLEETVEIYETALAEATSKKERQKSQKDLDAAKKGLAQKEESNMIIISDLKENSYLSLESRHKEIVNRCAEYGRWSHPHFVFLR